MANLNCNIEEEKVNWIIMNTTLNGIGNENYRLTEDSSIPPYNWYEEAIMWAMSENYFPNKSKDEVLSILRKYEIWNKFEKENNYGEIY